MLLSGKAIPRVVEKPTKCFICKEILIRNDDWDQDYCKKHEGMSSLNNPSGWTDWGIIMENLEKGFIDQRAY